MDHPKRYIKSLTSAPPVPLIVTSDSSTASTDSEKVLLFNKFFLSVFTLSVYQIPPLHESASPPLLYLTLVSLNPMCLKPCVHWIQLKPLESTVSVLMFFITVHLLSTNLSITYSYLTFPTPTFLQNAMVYTRDHFRSSSLVTNRLLVTTIQFPFYVMFGKTYV